ncbi:MAG: Cna B-type domain-containing protein, partial [Anaerotignum sp.]|nr:Cna B-type domain-containing protein [Anaerotignum sp.]
PFPIQVLFGDMYGTNAPSVPLAKDTEYTVTKADGTTEKREVKVAGIIELADDETARIEGILPGTRYLISEPEADIYTPVFDEEYGATGAVPVKGADGDGKEKIAKVSIVNRVTEFGLDIPLTKTVNGMPKYVAFEDDFEFVAELVSYEMEPENRFGAIFDNLQFLAKYRNNVAAADKTTSIEVDNGITATNSVGAASATKAGTLQLKFDLDTPNGVYTYKVKEVAKTGYAANRQEFTVKVKVDQSKDGDARAELMEGSALTEDVTALAFVNDRNENKLDVTVTKVWGTTENSKIQPTDSVTVKLMVEVEGVEQERASATLSEANDWTHEWKGVVADTETWTVVETPVPDKYNVSYDYDYTATTAAATVTNTPKGTTGGGGGDPDYGSLEISKITRGDTTFTANDVFNMAVTLDGAPISTDVTYTVTKADGTTATGNPLAGGIIPMNAGDVVLIEGILKGTDYTVREVVPADADFYATYAGPADATVTENGVAGAIAASTVHDVVVKNHSNEFGLSFNLLKQVFGLKPGDAYTFNFDIELFSYRDKDGNLVNNVVDPNKAEKSESITVTVPAAEVPEGEDVPAVAVETVPEGTGQFALNFDADDADTPSGTYVYVVTEKADYDLVKFKENKQKFAVTVVVDQDAEQRAVITSVKNEKGVELGTTAPLTFVNMTRDAAPKQVVSVVKEWKNDDTLRPAVTVELTVTLNGVESKETVELNAANGWRYTWNIDTDATWSVKEVGVKDHSTTDGKTWTMANTKAYYTTTTSEAKDVTVNGVDMKEVTITNTRNVPGGGGGGHDPKDPPKEEPPTPNNPTPEDPGDVLGENEELVDIGEDGTPLGDKELEDPLVAGEEEEVSLIAATGDNKIIVVAAAGMVAAVAGILALRKKKED